MLFTGNIILIVVVLFAFLFPLGLLIWWKCRTGEKLWSFLAGALCFVLFSMVLENLLHQVCLLTDNAVSRAILASPVLYTLYAAFAAGLFEETGRLFGFRVLLRRRNENACAVAYGIGHGGIEVILVLGFSYLVFLLAKLGVDFGSAETNAQILETANAIPAASALIAMFERISAVMLHVGLSMLVFLAAREKKHFVLYPLAILLHALMDMPAALYQYGTLKSLFAVEAIAFLMGLLGLLLGIRLLRARQTAPVED